MSTPSTGLSMMSSSMTNPPPMSATWVSTVSKPQCLYTAMDEALPLLTVSQMARSLSRRHSPSRNASA